MKRWKVEFSNGSFLKYYANTIDEPKNIFPEALSIVELVDNSFLKYVSRIQNVSTRKMIDYRGREIWEIPYYNGNILYRQFVDDNGEYIDGCAFQRWDIQSTVIPIMWDLCTPKEFFEFFVEDDFIPQYKTQTFISINELKKRNGKRIWNKDNVVYWRDSNGLFYFAEKNTLPTKRDIIEFQEYNGNYDAVYIAFGTELSGSERKWFKDMHTFLDFFNKASQDLSPQLGSLKYWILKKGYKKIHPHERNLILSLPYINLEKEIMLAKKKSNNIIKNVSYLWANRMKPFISVDKYQLDWLENMVIRIVAIFEKTIE